MFVNGQNLGRYWKIGPQETLYLPGPWLWKGSNEVRGFGGIFLCLFVLLKILLWVMSQRARHTHYINYLSLAENQRNKEEGDCYFLRSVKIREGAALKLTMAVTTIKTWWWWQLNFKALHRVHNQDKPDLMLIHFLHHVVLKKNHSHCSDSHIDWFL